MRNKICSKQMNFEECEMAILRNAMDNIELNKKIKHSTKLIEEMSDIIQIVEDFIQKKKSICYGGTAINNILPKEDQFYDRTYDLPDYDFYSPRALEHAKELANIIHKAGYVYVEAKAGIHHGTYKVFVNFIPIADITHISEGLYKALLRESIRREKIHYAPPNFLRMSMYLELSRPEGHISRWEKVLKRLTLLNKHYPLEGENCDTSNIQRKMEITYDKLSEKDEENIFYTVRNSCIEQGLVFFGALANKLYAKKYYKNLEVENIPDFDVLSDNPRESIMKIREKLFSLDILNKTDIKIRYHKGVSEIIAPHYELVVKGETVIFIYEPLACHSYNTIKTQIQSKTKEMRIASIDTMLSFYLAFIYANRKYYDKERILCLSEYLFKVQQKNRLSQRGILKRFNSKCYGEQQTIEGILQEKNNMFKLLKNKKGTKEYESWFLRYVPGEKNIRIPNPKHKSKHTRKYKKNIQYNNNIKKNNRRKTKKYKNNNNNK
jgi:hypothetical protein